MKALVTIIFLTFSVALLSFYQKQPDPKQIDRGKQLSKSCTNCHGTTKGNTAYPLQRIRQYRTKEWIYKFMKNPAGFAAENKEVAAMFSKRGYIMQAFPSLTKADINAILDYLDSLPYDPKEYKHRK